MPALYALWLYYVANTTVVIGRNPPRAGCHFEYAIRAKGLLPPRRLAVVYCQGNGRLVVRKP